MNHWPSPEEFEDLVDQALEQIPEALLGVIDNLAVTVEEWPTARQMHEVGLAPNHLLLGLYEGVPLTQRRESYGLVAPDKVTIFRGPILRICPPDAEAIRQQVRRTVIHEIAHHFGISDDRLRQLGAY